MSDQLSYAVEIETPTGSRTLTLYAGAEFALDEEAHAYLLAHPEKDGDLPENLAASLQAARGQGSVPVPSKKEKKAKSSKATKEGESDG